MNVTFITGNANKAKYLESYLGVPIAHQKIELDEIQSVELEVIVEHKVRQAYDILKSPVLVEDTSFSFKALSGLPGPFVKHFVDYAGLEAMCRMLDGFDDRSAMTECMFGYYDGREVVKIQTSVSGSIAQHPSGGGGYDWDKIFIQQGHSVVRAQLSPADYQAAYMKSKPFAELAAFLKQLG